MSKETVDKSSKEILEIAAKEKISTAWDRYLIQQPQCKFEILGTCCRMCNLGPCRVGLVGKDVRLGICGADADIVVARNLARNATAGTASHSDHARDLAHIFVAMGKGTTKGYTIKDPDKLRKIADEFGIKLDSKSNETIAGELGEKVLVEFGKQEGELVFPKRAPQRQQDIWKKLNAIPRGIDRDVVEMLARTHEGMDNDYINLIEGTIRVSLADGWGGSMIATELSDILFGSPQPIRSIANLGVLKSDEVNILIHGHEPSLSDVIAEVSNDPELVALAKSKGANGINIAGICCTANEILMRRGIPVAGSFLQQELAILTGAVESMVVDVQCIMPSLSEIAKRFHTKVISTSPKAKFPGMMHIEFKEELAPDIAKEIIKIAIENYPNRDKSRINIPKEKMDLIAGFTAENVFYHLGGVFRSTYRPLNENIANGRIRGVAGVVGCDNMKNLSGGSHIILVKELIKNDVLVVQTGCAAIACAKEGLLTPESAFQYAGKGLQEVCKAVGIPPVLHTGSCVDNSRILIACTEMVKEGGIGNSIDELPVAGAAPEWMSEKAIAIGWYFVASGILVVLGSPLHVEGGKNVFDYITKEMENITGGKWAFESDPIKMAQIMIEHIDKKREKLKLKPMMYVTKEEKVAVEV